MGCPGRDGDDLVGRYERLGVRGRGLKDELQQGRGLQGPLGLEISPAVVGTLRPA